MKFTSHTKAFTLIELLVVIAIVALLMSIVVPALKNAKRYATSAGCLANVSQLCKAWLLYATEHNDSFMDGDTSDELGANAGYSVYNRAFWGESSNIRVHNWVGRPMGPNGENRNDNIDDKVRGYERGALWPYIQNPQAYNCPADKRYLDRAVYPLNSRTANPPGLWIGGYRTYSITKALSRRPTGSGDPTGEMSVEIRKTSEFSNSSNKIVFLEETDGYGWNHRTWNMNLRQPVWGDPFAILHNDSSTFAFADGHADRRKWVDQQTRDMAEAQEKNWSAVDPRSGSTEDYQWFRNAYIPGRKPSNL
jgi:prepilin-type N-terminal cleavage/methylation domain-containing protein/prepilin-type processing-associated H-X9-DG protein